MDDFKKDVRGYYQEGSSLRRFTTKDQLVKIGYGVTLV